jgi:hypothetical protein
MRTKKKFRGQLVSRAVSQPRRRLGMKKVAAFVAAVALPLGLPLAALGDEHHHHKGEDECETLQNVPHKGWITIVCDDEVVEVINPGGHHHGEFPPPEGEGGGD